MSAMPDSFLQAQRRLAGALGQAVTVQRGAAAPVTLQVLVHDGIARIGDYGQVVGRSTLVDIQRADWQPRRGDVITIAGKARPVESIERDDGRIVTVVLHG